MNDVFLEETKYFITPQGNIVRGVMEGGKLVNAEYFTSKANNYSTPAQLNQLIKERNNLAAGKLELKLVNRPEFSQYNIPIDAGMNADGGKKHRKPRHKKSAVAGGATGAQVTFEDTEVDAGRRRHRARSSSRGRKSNAPQKMAAGGIMSYGPESTTTSSGVDAGKRRKSHRSSSRKSRPSKNDPNNQDSWGGSIRAGQINNEGYVANQPIDIEKKDKSQAHVTLADIFKHVSGELAAQAREIVTRGGDPTALLKPEIKFFNKF